MNKKSISGLIVIAIVVIGIIIGINVNKNNLKDRVAFTEENYKYMYSEIERLHGNGEKFNIENVTEEFIGETLTGVEGKKVSIIGYFESQEDMYIVVYAKYLEDKPIYKNGEAGNVICIAVNSNYTKEAYFNSNSSVD